MIPLFKLEKLPKKTRLRKIVSVLRAFELDIVGGRGVDDEYLTGLIDLMKREEGLGNFFLKYGNRWKWESPEAKLRFINQLRYRLQGLVGIETAEWDLIDLKTGKLDAENRVMYPIHVFLEDIRSPFNVGSIFRTAEAFGVESILLSESCPLPTHRRARRTSRGTVDVVEWRVVANLEEVKNFESVFALETGGVAIDEFRFPDSGVVLIGSEELGLSPEALELARESCGIVTIPMGGVKRSLNVSVAFGILMYFWYRRVRDSLEKI